MDSYYKNVIMNLSGDVIKELVKKYKNVNQLCVDPK